MRRLHPTVEEEELEALYLELAFPDPPADRPHVYLDMVASVDGAATVHGRTGPLGGEADRLAFSRLREWCDAILVGAETVRIEDYGPPRPTDESQARRRARGLAPVPTLIVITASGRLDPRARLFSDPRSRPVILLPVDAPDDRVRALEPVADLVRVGEGWVDLAPALAALRDRGVTSLLCEGGPTLNAALLRDGLVDELFLTISPQVVGTSRHRIVHGGIGPDPFEVSLEAVREHEGELLLRYRFVEPPGW